MTERFELRGEAAAAALKTYLKTRGVHYVDHAVPVCGGCNRSFNRTRLDGPAELQCPCGATSRVIVLPGADGSQAYLSFLAAATGPAHDGACYVGCEAAAGAVVLVVSEDVVYELPRSNHLRNHSPTGFAWGYGGSGPAQLALSLALDATNDVGRALNCYQPLKQRLVAGWRRPWFACTRELVLSAIEEIESGEAGPEAANGGGLPREGAEQ